MNDRSFERSAIRFAALSVLVLAVIVVPWLLWGQVIEDWVDVVLHSPTVTSTFVFSVVVLLALDVLLPIPSSFVAVAAGVFLGFTLGGLAVLVGLTLGSVIGYVIGARVGAGVARRMVGENGWRRAEEWSALHGSSVVLALRPVPILAEASTFFAGATRMRWGRYMTNSTVGNVGISVVYAGVGDVSADTGHLELALMAGCLLPAVAILGAGFVRRRKP